MHAKRHIHAPWTGRVRHLALAAAGTALVMSGLAAAADGGWAPAVRLHGFGTAGVVNSSEKNADFVHGFFEPNGAGRTHDWAYGVDTKIGVQGDIRLTDKLSAVIQLVSQHRYDNTYMPQLEWGNIKYQITPDFDVRVGRTVAMPFMASDSRLVGYGNPWIRPPQEVYGLIPITNKDGIDATYKLRFGEVTNTVHASYGRTSVHLPAAGSLKADDIFDVANTIEYGPFTARASYVRGRVDLSVAAVDALINGYTQLGNALSAIAPFAGRGVQALALADKYRFADAPISALALGASYDRDRWLVMAEWATFNGHSLLADSRAWYVTAGYRVGPLTPYLTAARLTAEQQTEAGVSPAGLPAPLAAAAAALNTGVNSALTSARFAQRSVSGGVRWDFAKNAAFKVQYDHIDLEPGSSGRLGNFAPNFQPGGRVHVFSVAIDFVF
ncbi:MAG TPA: hypothetical protein VED01_27190 [Burkholderiales bacterium]|nr:hypothetical protein [Burkholderiales bacterium]